MRLLDRIRDRFTPDDKIDFPYEELECLPLVIHGPDQTEFEVPTLPDTGCSISTISYLLIKALGFTKKDIRKLHIRTIVANGQAVKSIGVIKLKVNYKDISAEIHFLVNRDAPFCLLSMESCKKLKLIPVGFPRVQV